MAAPTEFTQRPATALIAFASAMAMDTEVDANDLDRLIQAVVTSPAERAALLSALSTQNAPEVRLIISDLLASWSAEKAEAEHTQKDTDEVIGPWGQRLSAGALLAGAGAAFSETLTPAVSAGVVISALALGILAAAARLKARRKRNALAKQSNLADTLAQNVQKVAYPSS